MVRSVALILMLMVNGCVGNPSDLYTCRPGVKIIGANLITQQMGPGYVLIYEECK